MSNGQPTIVGPLEHHRQDWETLARCDPLWAILSERGKKFGKWDEQEFFGTGASQVAHQLARAGELGHELRRERVLDFGCGVGRLAPSFSAVFLSYEGVDISEGMVDLARSFHASRANCTFSVVTDAGLARFSGGSFDFVSSLYVLQHLRERAMIVTSLRSLLRVLRPDGLLVFQLPEHIPTAERLLYDARRAVHRRLRDLGCSDDLLYRRLGLFAAGMNCVPEAEVLDIVAGEGAQVLDIERARAGIAIGDRTYYVSGPRPPGRTEVGSASTGSRLRGPSHDNRALPPLDVGDPSACLELLLRRAGPGGRGLDLGCGHGSWLPRMRSVGLRPVGLERDHERARGAVPLGPVVVADAAALPLRAASVDVVACIQVLHHVADPAAVLSAVRAVLAVGGHLVLAESVEDSPLMRLARQLRPEWEGVPVRSRFRAAELEGLLIGTGFEILEWRHHSPVSFLALVLPWTRGRPWRALTRLETRAPRWVQRRGAHLECLGRAV